MDGSGLVDRPDVSHYRLTTHLGLAVFVYCSFWTAFRHARGETEYDWNTVQNGLVDCSSWCTALYYQEVWLLD